MLSIPPAPTLQDYLAVVASGQQLTVGGNKQYATIQDALAAAQSGDTILVDAGTYTTGQIDVDVDVRLLASGGTVHLKAGGNIGKGILTTKPGVSLYVENFKFSGASNSDKNGAGIRHQGKDLTVVDSIFQNNQDGILATGDSTAKVYISGSEFDGNGHSSGLSHGIYINVAQFLVVTDSHFHDTVVGHHIKSMASSTTWVVNTILDDAGGDSSYAIDVTLGGNLYATGNTITQSAASQNNSIVNYTTARGGIPGDVIFDNNVITDNHANGNFIRNTTDTIVQIYNNQFFEGAGSSLNITGISDQFGNSMNGVPLPDMDHLFGATFGSSGGDKIDGTGASDKIAGLGGNDILTGGTGNQAGDDTIYGGGGNDSLSGGNGSDYLSGGDGNDYIEGGSQEDTLVGNDGNDTITALSTSKNAIYGGDGDDVLYGGDWKDEINGGNGFDIAVYEKNGFEYNISYAKFGKIRVQDSSGTDDVIGVEAFQFANGVYWTETFKWEPGKVIVDIPALLAGKPPGQLFEGSNGDDVLVGGGGGDTIMGFKGHDSISGFAGIDIIYGHVGQDTLRGGTELDVLFGGIGNDVLIGESGNDYIEGNEGDDSILGGTFGDTLKGGDGNDTIDGGAGQDIIEGGDGDDMMIGRGGSDIIVGYRGNDTILGGTFDDILVGMAHHDSIDGGNGNDRIFLGYGKDTASGGNGNDTIQGLNGDDLISGDDGNDVIRGEQGADTLIGGNGRDVLKGGTEADVFRFDSIDGVDTVQDFEDGLDLIEITGGLSFLDVSTTQVGADLEVAFGSTTVRLIGIDENDIDASDFLFS